VTSAIGWRHEKRFFMTSATGWRHEKRFFMTSAIGWRHEKMFFMTSAIGWRHENRFFVTSDVIKTNGCVMIHVVKKAQSPCSNATFYFAVDFLHVLGPNVYKRRHWYSCRKNVGMKQRMHRFGTAHSVFCSNFRGETSYSHVHHAENRTRGMSFLDAPIRESRWH
jgi:hypothetical protein